MNGYEKLKLQYKENLNTDKALIKIIKYLLNQTYLLVMIIYYLKAY